MVQSARLGGKILCHMKEVITQHETGNWENWIVQDTVNSVNSYGENRDTEIPVALVEVGFHTNPDDARAPRNKSRRRDCQLRPRLVLPARGKRCSQHIPAIPDVLVPSMQWMDGHSGDILVQSQNMGPGQGRNEVAPVTSDLFFNSCERHSTTSRDAGIDRDPLGHQTFLTQRRTAREQWPRSPHAPPAIDMKKIPADCRMCTIALQAMRKLPTSHRD